MRLPNIKTPNLPPKNRVFAIAAVQLMFFSVLTGLPLASWVTANKYKLNSEVIKAVGEAKPELAKKLNFNSETGMYEFNPEGKKIPTDSDDPEEVAKMLQKRQGVGESKEDKGLYSLELSPDSKKGITIHDNNMGLSVTIVPKFNKGQGRKVQDRVVYPMPDGAKAIYTVKSNGLKEDIVYEKAPESGEASFAFDLQLPKDLEARIQGDQSLGIFSASPTFYGDISFGSDKDKKMIEEARSAAVKDTLVFSIPRPVIVAANGDIGKSYAWFDYKNGELTVNATHLDTIQGTFSIDPTITVASTSDFSTGTNQEGTGFGNNEIRRSEMGSGRLLSNTTNGTFFNEARWDHTTVVHNGYMYVIGGYTGANPSLSDVQYALICTGANNGIGGCTSTPGSIGTWVTDSDSPLLTGRDAHTSIVYNNYLYVIGGYFDDVITETVHYAPFNSDGSIGAWQATTSLPSARHSHSTIVYNGFVYVLGGDNGTAILTQVLYAGVNGDGSIGAWQSTTALPFATFSDAAAIVYNGYIYISGGKNSVGGATDFVRFSRISSDGTIGSWITATSLPTVREGHTMVAQGGYLYFIGGLNTSTSTYANSISFAQIRSDGSIGNWVGSGVAFSNGRDDHTSVFHNGFAYIIGGFRGPNPGTRYADIQYSAMEIVGHTTSYQATTQFNNDTLNQGTGNGREGHGTVIANGYIYVVGGLGSTALGSVTLSDVQYAPIDSAGNVGTWVTGAPLQNGRHAHATVVYGNYVYVVGGRSGSTILASTEYSQINDSTGELGAWTSTTDLPVATERHAAVAYNNTIYVLGGFTGTRTSVVRRGFIGFFGNITSWGSATNLTSARDDAAATVLNNRLYILGGDIGSARLTTVQYADIDNDGGLGSWTATTSMPVERSNLRVVTWNGYIYFAGGGTGGGISSSNTVYFAYANPNGSMSSWTQAATLNTAKANFGAAIDKGKIYIAGGTESGTRTRDVRFATISNGGSGELLSWTRESSLLNTERYRHQSVAYNDCLYALGGIADSGSVNTVEYSPVIRGFVTGWNYTTPMNTARVEFGAAVYNGYIYAVGGRDAGVNQLASVEVAKINDDCTLGPWNYTTSLDTSVGSHAVVALNGYVYSIGGKSGATQFSKVMVTKINTDGSLGQWQATANMTETRDSPQAFTANGHIYIMGGSGASSTIDKVLSASPNSNGTISAWKTVGNTPFRLQSFVPVVYNGNIYLTGGVKNGTFRATAFTFYAAIFSQGGLGDWHATLPMPNERTDHTALVYKGYLFITGGRIENEPEPGNFTYTITRITDYGILNSAPRSASYAKTLDLGALSDISSIKFNGLLNGFNEGVQFKTAPTNAIFTGNLKPISSIATACSISGRYILLVADLSGGNQQSVFPDAVSSTRSSVQSLTIDYTLGEKYGVRPQDRLRGGKYFFQESQMALDTVKSTTIQTTTSGCNPFIPQS